jgi:hypothetical protein
MRTPREGRGYYRAGLATNNQCTGCPTICKDRLNNCREAQRFSGDKSVEPHGKVPNEGAGLAPARRAGPTAH